MHSKFIPEAPSMQYSVRVAAIAMNTGFPRPWELLHAGIDLKTRGGTNTGPTLLHHNQDRRRSSGRQAAADGRPASPLTHLVRNSLRATSANSALLQQLKQPSAIQAPRHTTGASSSFTKSFGPGRHAPTERPPTRASRPTHARSKSQAPRPRTAHGNRLEEPAEPSDGTSTIQSSSSLNTSLPPPLHITKHRSQYNDQLLQNTRTSSLIDRFDNLSLDERELQKQGIPVNVQFSQSISQLPRFPTVPLFGIYERSHSTDSLAGQMGKLGGA